MRIIIAGDGDTGTHLARMLSVENQDIILIGSDREKLAALDSVCNFITFEGSPMSRNVLMQCGADTADLFVAVTPEETVNLIACEIAKDCGTSKCVARVDTPEFGSENNMFRRHGIDMTIYPEKLAAAEIKLFIGHNWVSDWFQFHGDSLFVVGVRMETGGLLCGKYLRDVPNNPRLFHVAAIRRGEKIIIPHGDDRLMDGDTIYFAVTSPNINLLAELCGKRVTQARHIMISGAGRVTENLLEMLGGKYDVTVIDPDKRRCSLIASRFPATVVINATANDISTLREEGIGRCDTFLALTGSSETNIVSCMVAREHGVPKTLARIEELQYIPEAESLSIDKIVNKKLINAGRILNIMLDSDMAITQCLSLGNAEITEITAKERSKITSRPIAELSLPRGLTIAGLIRNGNGLLAEGSTEILPGDHVIVFCLSGTLSNVSRFFR